MATGERNFGSLKFGPLDARLASSIGRNSYNLSGGKASLHYSGDIFNAPTQQVDCSSPGAQVESPYCNLPGHAVRKEGHRLEVSFVDLPPQEFRTSASGQCAYFAPQRMDLRHWASSSDPDYDAEEWERVFHCATSVKPLTPGVRVDELGVISVTGRGPGTYETVLLNFSTPEEIEVQAADETQRADIIRNLPWYAGSALSVVVVAALAGSLIKSRSRRQYSSSSPSAKPNLHRLDSRPAAPSSTTTPSARPQRDLTPIQLAQLAKSSEHGEVERVVDERIGMAFAQQNRATQAAERARQQQDRAAASGIRQRGEEQRKAEAQALHDDFRSKADKLTPEVTRRAIRSARLLKQSAKAQVPETADAQQRAALNIIQAMTSDYSGQTRVQQGQQAAADAAASWLWAKVSDTLTSLLRPQRTPPPRQPTIDSQR